MHTSLRSACCSKPLASCAFLPRANALPSPCARGSSGIVVLVVLPWFLLMGGHEGKAEAVGQEFDSSEQTCQYRLARQPQLAPPEPCTWCDWSNYYWVAPSAGTQRDPDSLLGAGGMSVSEPKGAPTHSMAGIRALGLSQASTTGTNWAPSDQIRDRCTIYSKGWDSNLLRLEARQHSTGKHSLALCKQCVATAPHLQPLFPSGAPESGLC